MKELNDAVLVGDIETLKRLIGAGADVETKDRAKRTLLTNAVIDKRMEMATYLIEKGADVNSKDSSGYTALHLAAQNLSYDLCKLLLSNGAAVDPQDEYGNTPLWRAAMNACDDDHGVIRLLLDHGADGNLENASGVSPLSLANAVTNWDLKQYFQD